jgi:hypothetical protein
MSGISVEVPLNANCNAEFNEEGVV